VLVKPDGPGSAVAVDDVVAVEVELEDGSVRFFITWGRVQDAVDPGPVEALVLKHSSSYALGGAPRAARVCGALREAADSDAAPYFHECLMRFSRDSIPFGPNYQTWRAETGEAMRSGAQIAYCGNPEAAKRPTV
jgi:hypothetical protein